jgi:hypothetical protein
LSEESAQRYARLRCGYLTTVNAFDNAMKISAGEMLRTIAAWQAKVAPEAAAILDGANRQ